MQFDPRLGPTRQRFDQCVERDLEAAVQRLQVALPISLIVAIVAEMAMGGYGLGGAMMSASRFADSRGVFAGIVEIAIVGYVLIKAMALVRRRLLAWHQETAEHS